MNIQNVLRSAFEHYQSGRLQESEVLCKKILQKQPKNHDVLHLLGIVYYGLGNYDSAVNCIEKSIKFKSGNALAFFNLGNAYRKKSQSDEAIINYRKAIQINPQLPDAYNNLGISLQDKGLLDKAIENYKMAIQLDPALADVYYNLGTAFQDKRLLDEAEIYYQRACQLDPMSTDAWYKLGNILHEKGFIDESLIFYKKAIQLNPDLYEGYYHIGNIYTTKNNPDEAILCYRKALQINPDFGAASFELARIFQKQEKIDDAIALYERAVGHKAESALLFFNLGALYYQKGLFQESILNYSKALLLDPASAIIYNNLGLAQQAIGQINEAIESFEKALLLDLNSFDVYNNLGVLFISQKKPLEAIPYLKKALRINPACIETYHNLGLAYTITDRIDDAIDCYRKALQISPDSPEKYVNLGELLFRNNMIEDAISIFDQALQCNPKYISAQWVRCISHLPIIYENECDIGRYRERYSHELFELQNTISLSTPSEIEAAAQSVGMWQPFYLAYQGMNDRELQKVYGTVICTIMSQKYPLFSGILSPAPLLPGEPIRIGIVSGFFYRHSNWKIPIKGWVENMDKKRFELYGYYTGNKKDEETKTAGRSFKRFIEDIKSFEELCRIIREDNLHILIYPEIGMDPVTLKLASLRLAPVQCTSWGHPDTSGLPTIDYYLSSDLMEPPDADSHYSEKLIRLPNLSIYYTPLENRDIDASREKFGLKEGTVLYLCCQSSSKYLPQYDEIYPRIAKEVQDCQFAFISNINRSVTEKFHMRLKKTFEKYNLNADDYIEFLPRLDSDQYHAVDSLSDIYLDSIGWNGCNSTLEAIACDLPIVTLPGKLMRGRHSYAILKMMGVTESVAATVDDYVRLAVKLGKNIEYRKEISDKIAKNKQRLYEDKICIIALEQFLENAVRESHNRLIYYENKAKTII